VAAHTALPSIREDLDVLEEIAAADRDAVPAL